MKEAEQVYGKLKLKIHTKRYTIGHEFKGRSAIARILDSHGVMTNDLQKQLRIDSEDNLNLIEANETKKP